MKNFIIIFFLFFNIFLVNAQSLSGNTLNNFVVAKSDTANFKVVVDSLISILPDKSIYLIGETHRIKANDLFFFPLIKSMCEKKNVKYVIMEMDHSYYFGTNLFLKYGDVKILADFDKRNPKDSLKWNRQYSDLIDLYRYNEKQPIDKKIEFLGLEFDITNIPFARPFTSFRYVTAIKYFRKYNYEKLPAAIDKIFQDITSIDVNDVKLLLKKDKELQKLAIIHQNDLKKCFGDFYKDFYIIMNSARSYPANGRRDGGMVNNLQNAYQILKENEPNSDPKFFGSFGAAHVIPGNNGSLASKMNSSSIIKGGVAFIGTSYFNSNSYYSKTIKEIDNSSLHGLSNKDEALADAMLKDVSIQQQASIVLLGRFNNIQNKEFNFLKGFDAVFVFSGFK